MKKQLLTFSLFLMSIGMFSQSTIWMPHNANIDTAMGCRWLSAVSPTTAWEIGYSRHFNTAVYNVFTRTQDGGATFTPGMFLPDTLYYNSSNISAVNDSVAYIPCYSKDASRNGVVMKTMDRGLTWANVADTSFMFMTANNFPDWAHFYDNNHGIVLGDPNGNTSGSGSEFEIYKTFNGGTTWMRVPDAAIPNPGSGEYGVTDVFTFYGKKHLWFGTNHGGSAIISHIYRSNDTGNTWQSATIAGLNAGVSGIAFRDSLNGLAWGVNTTTANSPFVLKRTNDGGITWATIIQHNNVGIFDITAVPGRNAFLSVGLDSSHAAYITSVTYDDGMTWNVLESGIQEAQRMIQVTMLDSANGWAGCFSDNTNVPFGTSGMANWMSQPLALGCPVYVTGIAAICSGSVATLTAHGAATYTWSANAGSVTTNSASVSPTTSAVFTVSVNGGYGCTNTSTYSLTVNPSPTVTAVATSYTICNLNSTSLSASGATSFNWAPNTGLSSTSGATVTATYTTSGVFTYTVTGNTAGCIGTNTISINVLPCVGINEVSASVASIYPNPSNGNITINFSNAAATGTKVVVTDLIGNNVFQSYVNSGISQLNMDLRALPKGMYLVNVSNTTGSVIKKMIIE